MASDGASPLPGPDMTLKPGATLSSLTALPFPQPASDPPDQPLWEQPPIPSAFSPGNPLVLSALPSPLLVTGDGEPGPTGAGVIVKVKTEVGPAEPSQTQNFILTQPALNWIASSNPCGDPEGPPPQFMTAANMKALLPTKAVGVSQEGFLGLPAQAPPPAAQLAPIVSPEKAWPEPHGATREGGPLATQSKPSLGDLSYTSKGVYENFQRWQRYKALARKHLSQSPDVEALSCFLIPVLRSLARLKPTMTLEEGLPRAVQEWEHTSNFDRMIFYEMAEKFMEFEAEEEMQIQNTKLMNGSSGLPPAAPLKLDPPGLLAPEVGQQPVYMPKKVPSKARAPRRRQRKTQRPPIPEAPKEIPPEAVKEYADIMEGLVGSHLATGESDGKQEEEEQQQEEEGMYPDPGLLSYMDELCSQEVFVSKVEAVIHPRFLADLLSPEQQRDPLALIDELEQEEGLSLAQLVQKRLLALEEEDAEASPTCSGAQSDSSPSISDEDEDGGGRLRPSPGPRVAGRSMVRVGKAAFPARRAREVRGGQERTLDGLRAMHRNGSAMPPPSSWALQLELPAAQGTRGSFNVERRGPGKVTDQICPHQDDHLGDARSPGHSLVADSTSDTPPLCWQEGPQLEMVPSLDVGLAELAPLQEQELEKQVLGLQTGQQLGGLGVLPQGEQLLAVPQEGSSGAMWGDARGPSVVQSYDQSPSSREAGDGDGDRASLSPGLWLSSELEAVGLELPLQIEEVIENFHVNSTSRECVAEHQGGYQVLGSRGNISLGPEETIAPGEGGSSAVPSGGTDSTATVHKRNYESLPRPLRANSPSLRPKGNGEQSPEATGDPSELWAEGCPSLLDSRISAPTLGAPKETLQTACQGNIFMLGTQGISSFPEVSLEVGSGGNSISPLLETIEHVNILDIRDAYGLHLGVSEDTCLPNFNSYDPQGERREDTDVSKPEDLAPLPGNQESYADGTPKSTSPHQGLESTFSRWGARDALVLRDASPVSETCSSTDGAKGREEEREEKEDEELASFAYLLASKLSLSPRGPPFSPHSASGPPASTGGQGVQRAPNSHSAEARGLGQPPYPVAKSGKRTLSPTPAEKSPYQGAELGVSGEKPLALEVPPASQPRKRRRDTFVTGRRKKRRRSQ
ncbi:NUT family member 1 [Hyaena hyaena]|uniref:NUT family member 1 n=1 Tax=Hyaena hyaena TaxID=95912 RepID=UPI001922EA23|nr:NUT family member 1 [Hyaena hyaena]